MAGDVIDCWESLGRQLGVSQGKIENIQRDLNYSPREKAFQVLWVWFNMHHSSTFGELVNALEDLGKDALVEKHC